MYRCFVLCVIIGFGCFVSFAKANDGEEKLSRQCQEDLAKKPRSALARAFKALNNIPIQLSKESEPSQTKKPKSVVAPKKKSPEVETDRTEEEEKIAHLSRDARRAYGFNRTRFRDNRTLMAEVFSHIGDIKDLETRTLYADFLYFEILKKLVVDYNTVFLALGNRSQEPSKAEAKRYQKVAEAAVKKGYLVFYDADSAAAPLVRKVVGQQGIGVTGGKPYKTGKSSQPLDPFKENLVVISNAYLRFELFGKSNRRVYTSTNSPLGVALRLHGATELFVIEGARDPSDWYEGFTNWCRGEERKEFHFSDTAKVFPGMDKKSKVDIEEVAGYRDIWSPRSFSLVPEFFSSEKGREWIDRESLFLDRWSLERVDDRFALLASELPELEKLPTGMAVFGFGSLLPPRYETLLRNFSGAMAAQGVPVYTGGAGGAMRIANTAAFVAGAESVGVPVVGKLALSGESKTFSEVQTRTFRTEGYDTRILFLLHRRPLVTAVAGGSGTIRELSTVLFKMGAGQEGKLLLLGDYYDGLFKEIKNSGGLGIEDAIEFWPTHADLEIADLVNWVENDTPKQVPFRDTAELKRREVPVDDLPDFEIDDERYLMGSDYWSDIDGE